MANVSFDEEEDFHAIQFNGSVNMLQGLHNNLSLFRNLSGEDRDPFYEEEPVLDPSDKMSWPNLLWTISFTVIVVVGTLGNAIVLWIILGHRHMWNSTNYFLVNLSIVDLLMALLNTLFNFIFMRDKNWPFGATYCTINNFVAYLTVAASVLTLMAITLDRYRAILYPLKPKLSKWYIILAIFCVWGVSSLVALPALLYSRTFSNG
ncbi:tachykinin-like peptides receptor 86C [Tigriopus californicus]|nr:tachykinin-like peptides receptor 86C [Tigriopus californicus]